MSLSINLKSDRSEIFIYRLLEVPLKELFPVMEMKLEISCQILATCTTLNKCLSSWTKQPSTAIELPKLDSEDSIGYIKVFAEI